MVPHLKGLGRCLVPDLIGMGESDPLPESGPGSYRFTEHAEFLEEFLQKLEVHKDAILVGHDWGGALLFHWAMQHPDAVQGIVYMETIVSPVSWRDWPEDAKGIFQVCVLMQGKNRSPEKPFRRRDPSKFGPQETDRRRDECLPQTVFGRRGEASSDAHLAARNPHRRGT